jgi:hypothetical protein
MVFVRVDVKGGAPVQTPDYEVNVTMFTGNSPGCKVYRPASVHPVRYVRLLKDSCYFLDDVELNSDASFHAGYSSAT